MSKPREAKTAVEQLDITERQFVTAITDKDNPKTFNNAKQSYLAVRPHVTPDSAEVQGCRVLRRDRVQAAIEEVLEAAGCGTKVRVQTLSSFLSGRSTRKTTIYRIPRDAEGKQIGTEPVIDQVIEAEPTFNERNKAIDILNKMAGTYAQAQVAGRIAEDEYADLRARIYPKLRNVTREAQEAHEVQEGTGEGDCGTP